ncbi:MAG: filamentous hemagglutinin N-terminal domain-containing protein [Endomicrobia bacterium]|nr:filamentous hemagglutinin N-terminal domain-containing protein [Endomicrobiia bacterium]
MLKKTICVLIAVSFIFTQTGFAQVVTNIQADTSKTQTTVTQSGNTYDVNTTTVHNRTGFNAFTNFDLGAGDIANLNLPSNTDNLVNMVTGNNKSFIDGTLNAYRDGKIGGNVFFLNPNGIAIGATGIVNVGALTLATPDKSYIDSILNDNSKFAADTFSKAVLDGDVPINRSGSISVKGKINAYYGAAVHAGNVEVSGPSAQINTLKAADIINLDDVSPVEMKEIGGRILITAKKIDINDGASIKSERETAESKSGDIQISAYDNASKLIAETEAEINIENAVIEGNNVSIEASVKNDYSYEDVKVDWDSLYEEIKERVKNDITPGNFGDIIKDLIASGFDFGDIDLSSIIDLQDIEDAFTDALNVNTFIAFLNKYVTDKISGAYAKSDVKAKITVGSASAIKAEETLNIKTDVYSKTNVNTEADAVAAAVGINSSVSEITIKSGAVLESGGEANIKALSTIVSEMSAKTSDGDNFGTLSAVISAVDNTTRIEVESGADINAAGDILINAVTGKTSEAKVSGPETEDGNFGAGFIHDSSVIDNEIVVNGSITSQTGGIDILSSINASKKINNSNESMLNANVVYSKDVIGTNSGIFIGDKNNAQNSLTAGKGIKISADLNSEDSITAKSSLLSAAVKDADTSVKINIENALLSAQENVNIAARTKETDNITAYSALKRSDDDSKNFAVSASLLFLDNKTSVNIADDAFINSGKDVNIEASTAKNLTSSAEVGLSGSGQPEGLLLALMTAYSDIKTDNSVTVAGQITADGNVSINSSVTAEKNATQALESGGGWDKRLALETANSALSEADKKVEQNEKMSKVARGVSEAINENGDGGDIAALITSIAQTVAENPQEALTIAQTLYSKLQEEGSYINIADAWQEVCSKIEADLNSAKQDAATKKETQQNARQEYENSLGGQLSAGAAFAQATVRDNSGVLISGDITGKSVNIVSGVTKKNEEVYTKSDGLAVAVNDNSTVSNVIVNSKITASDAINISAATNVTAKTESKIGSLSISSFEAAMGAAVSNVNTDNFVNISAQLESENDVAIKAETNKNITVNVDAIPVESANLGIGLVYNDSVSNNGINISNDITSASGGINITADLTDKSEVKSRAKAGNIIRNGDTANKKFGVAGAVVYSFDENNNTVNISGDSGRNVTLTSGKDINIVSKLAMDSKTAADGAGAAVAVIGNFANAFTGLQYAVINSGNDVNIKSTLNIKSVTESVSGVMTILSFDGGAAAAVSTVITGNIISIAKSVINAVNNVAITALTNAELSASAKALTGKASNAGVSVSDSMSDINNEIIIKDSEINSGSTDINSLINAKENANNVSSGTEEEEKNPVQDDDKSQEEEITIDLGGFELPSFDLAGIFNFDFNFDFSKIFLDLGLGSINLPGIDIGGILSKISIGDFGLPGISMPNFDIGKIFGSIGIGSFDLSGMIPDIGLPHIGLPDFGLFNFNFGDWFKGFDLNFDLPQFGGINWDFFKFGSIGSIDWGKFNPGSWNWAGLNPKNINFDWALDFGIDWLRNGGGNSKPEKKIAIGGTLALGDHTKNAGVTIDNVTFASEDNININAILIDPDIKISAEAGIKDGANFEVAGAVIYSHINDYAKVSINNSILDAGKTISVNSLHLIPMTGEEWLNDFNGKDITGLAQTAFDKLKGGPLEAVRNNLVNFWVRSSGADNSGFAASGGVNILYFDFASEASITNSQINQNESYRTGDQKVEIKSESDTTFVNVGGILGFGSDKAAGGIYNQVTYDNNTKAYISDSDVYANEADITSSYKQHDITIGVSGASAGDFALEGVLNMLDSSANVDAYIDGGKVEVSGGNLRVDASNNSLFVNVAGAIDLSNKISVGLTGAVNEVLRNTNAYIKNIQDLLAGNINISAVNGGIIHSYSIAGSASTKESNGPGIVQDLKDKAADWLESLKKSNKAGKKENPGDTNNEGNYQSAGNEETGAFGLGISGSASINDVEGYAQAYMENVTVKDSGDINISAQENSKITSASGAVALNLQSGEGSSGAAIAGAVSINLIDTNAVSYIKNSTIENAGNIALNSLSASLIQAIAASLPISTSKSGLNVAGSVTVNKINSEQGIISFVENSVIKASELSLNAKEKSEIKSLAGALAISASSISVGAGVGVNTIKNTVSAYLLNSDAVISGALSLLSQNIAKIETLAATVGIISGTVGIAASVLINDISNKTESYIKGKNDVDGKITADDIAVIAEDDSEIDALAGEISAAKTAGVGAAVGINKIENKISAYIENAVINSVKNIDMQALSSGIIKLITASLGGGKVGVVGSVSVNDISNTAKAGIYGSDISVDGSIGVFAQNSDYIQLISGGVAIGGTAGVGGNVGLNYISNKSIAEIAGSNITALGKYSISGIMSAPFFGLSVKSNIDDTINVYNLAAAGAGTAAIAGGVAGAIIENESIAKIQDSEINKNNTEAGTNQNVSVLADNKIEVNSYGGAAAAAGTVGVGIAADFLTLNNKVEAGILNSIVKAKNDVEVKTNSKEKYNSVVVAGAGSGGVSIAGSVAVVQTDVKNNAYIKNSDIESGNDTTVKAEDAIELGEGNLGMMVGSAAGGLYAGVAGSAFVGNISNKTNALIENSNVSTGKSLNILSESVQKIKATIPSLAGALVGIGLTASVISVNSKTTALADGAATNLETGQDLNIEAKNKLELEETLVALAGGFVGVGASVAVGNINNDVTAGIGNNVKAQSGRDVNVAAENDRNIKNTVVSAAGGFVGANGSVSVLTVGGNINSNSGAKENTQGYNDELNSAISRSGNYNEENAGHGGLTSGYIANMNQLDITAETLYGQTEINNGTNAFIGKGAQITAGNDINVSAADKFALDSTVGGASGGFVGIGASVNITDITTLANAYVDNGAMLKAKNNINVISNNNVDKVRLWTFIGTGGFVAANAAVSILDLRNDSYARIGNNVDILRANDINILANSKSVIDNEIDRVTIGAFVTGATVATVDKKGTTEASVGDNLTVEYIPVKEEVTASIVNKSEINLDSADYIEFYFDGMELTEEMKQEFEEMGIVVNTAEDLKNYVLLINVDYTEDTENIRQINSFNVAANSDNVIKSNSFSGAVGAVSVHGDIFEVSSDETVSAYIGKNASIFASDKVSVLTNGNTSVNSKFLGLFAALVDVGAAIAKIDINFNNKAYIDDNGEYGKAYIDDDGVINIIKIDDVLINAKQNASVDVKTGIDTAALVGVSGAAASANIGGNVDAYIGNNNNIYSNNLVLSAKAVTEQEARADMIQLGLAAIGAGYASSKADINVKAELKDSLNIYAGNAFNIDTLLSNTMHSVTESGKVGVITAGGAFAVTENKSTNNVIMGSQNAADSINIRAENFSISAKNITDQDSVTSAKSVSLGNGAYVKNQNLSDSQIDVSLDGKINLRANNIYIEASNKYYKNTDGKENTKSQGLSGLDLFVSDSNTDIFAYTKINFGADTDISTYKSGNISNFIVDAVNEIYAKDIAGYISFSLLNGSQINNRINNNSSAEINFNGKIKAAGSFITNVRTQQDVRTYLNANILSGGVLFKGNTRTNSDIKNTVNVNEGADIFAANSVYFNVSQDHNGSISFYNTSSFTDIYLTAMIPLDGSTARTDFTVSDSVNIAEGANVKAAETIDIGAWNRLFYGEGNLNVYKLWLYFIPAEDHKLNTNKVYNSVLKVDGGIYAGYNNNISININGIYGGDNFIIENEGSRENIGYRIIEEEFENNLYKELELISQQLLDYRGSEENRLALEAEKQKILFQMELLGMSTNWGNNNYSIDKYEVDTIEFADIHVGIGDIRLNMDNVFGGGTISAADAPKIFVNNNSSLFLKFNDIVISNNNEATGQIYFNDVLVTSINDISKLNLNQSLNVNFQEFSFGSGNNESQVMINSSQTNLDLNPDFNLRPSITFNGNLENNKGLVYVNADGDIFINSQVSANDLHIESKNGSIVQSYWDEKNKDYVFHLTKPSEIWASVALENEGEYTGEPTYELDYNNKDVKFYLKFFGQNWVNANYNWLVGLYPKRVDADVYAYKDSNIPVDDRTTSSMIANNIFISGRYLDINGLVQAGRSDYDLNIADNNLMLKLGADGKLTGSIADALKYYEESSPTEIKSSLFELAGIHGNITAYYDVLTKEITIDDIYVRGGGKLELYGQIINTSSQSGEIIALDGYSKVNIDNNSDYKINIKNINISEKAEGSIKITDLAYNLGTAENPRYLQTLYTFNGVDIVKTDNTTVDENGKGNNVEVLSGSGRNTSYLTMEGQRYNWATGNTASAITTWTKVTERRSLFGWDDGVWGSSSLDGFIETAFNVNDKFDLSRPEYISYGNTDSPLYMFIYRKEDLSEPVVIPLPPVIKERWTGLFNMVRVLRITETKIETQEIANYHTHSIKADNPIKIGFIGYNDPQNFIVNSNSDIMLKGNINTGNQADVILNSNKAIDSFGIGNIIARSIDFNAVNGIGNTYNINVNLLGGAISAENKTKGDINIRVKSFGNDYDTLIDNITNNGSGKINIISDNNIKAGNENTVVKGNIVNLISNLGGIYGFNDNPLNIDANILNAYARDDINFIKTTVGNLNLGKIESVFGDVNLEVQNGSIFNNKVVLGDDKTSEEYEMFWNALDLYNEAGWTADKLEYTLKKASEQSDFNIIGNKVTVKASGSIGSDIETFSFKASEFNALSKEQQESIIAASILNGVSVSDETSADPTINVSFRDDVKIYAKEGMNLNAGTFISLGGKEDLNIISAVANGNINIKGEKGIYNFAQEHIANLQGENITINSVNSSIGLADKALCVDASGILTANAKNNIYIHLHGADNIINTITAGNKLDLHSEGNILTNDNSITNIIAHNINIEADNVGTRDNNINIALVNNEDSQENNLINISANDSLYVNNTGFVSFPNVEVGNPSSFVVGSMTADNNAVINSEYGDIIGFDGNSYISARNIELNAKKGNIGKSNNKLKVTGFELISGYAKNNIEIEIITPESLGLVASHPELDSGSAVYNIGDLKADEGYINMYSSDSGINVKGEIDAKESINADIYGNITDDIGNNTAGFYSKNINLISKKGSIGSKDNNIRIGGSNPFVIPESSNRESMLNASAEGGIYIESDDTIVVSKVETEKSDVRLESGQDIKSNNQNSQDSNIIAQNIELKAEGSIGEEDNRLITETAKEKGRINIDAGKKIYIKQNGTNIFYSDYIRNRSNSDVSLLLPGSHAYIVDLDIENPNKLRIDFLDNKNKNNVSIGHNAIEKLTIHPRVVKHNREDEEMEDKYELLKSIENNIIIHPDLFKLLKPLNAPLRPISKFKE